MKNLRASLESQIKSGKINSVGLPTENWAWTGTGENTYRYYTSTGIVTRTTPDGKVTEFGNFAESRHKTGYLCAEIVLPYEDGDLVSPENIITDGNGVIIGRQYTAYIHQIASIVGDLMGLNGNHRGMIANHKDGCPGHNWASNIETVDTRLNAWHGAVYNSIISQYVDFFDIGVDSNKVDDFIYLRTPISAYDVEDFMSISLTFRDEVMRSSASMRQQNVPNKYISDIELWEFWFYLKRQGKV